MKGKRHIPKNWLRKEAVLFLKAQESSKADTMEDAGTAVQGVSQAQDKR